MRETDLYHYHINKKVKLVIYPRIHFYGSQRPSSSTRDSNPCSPSVESEGFYSMLFSPATLNSQSLPLTLNSLRHYNEALSRRVLSIRPLRWYSLRPHNEESHLSSSVFHLHTRTRLCHLRIVWANRFSVSGKQVKQNQKIYRGHHTLKIK